MAINLEKFLKAHPRIDEDIAKNNYCSLAAFLDDRLGALVVERDGKFDYSAEFIYFVSLPQAIKCEYFGFNQLDVLNENPLALKSRKGQNEKEAHTVLPVDKHMYGKYVLRLKDAGIFVPSQFF